MTDTTPFLPGLSPVRGKEIVARFDGGRLSSDGRVLLLLREIEARLGIADLIAGGLPDATHGPAPTAFIIPPLVGAFFVDITKAFVIQLFLSV